MADPCYLQLEDGTGRLRLEDGSGFLLLEFCANDNQGGGGKPWLGDAKPAWQSYELSKHEWEEEQRRLKEAQRKTEAKLEAKQAEIDKLEARRIDQLANQAMQIELVALLRQLAALEAEKAAIMLVLDRQRRDQDAILVLLLSLGL